MEWFLFVALIFFPQNFVTGYLSLISKVDNCRFDNFRYQDKTITAITTNWVNKGNQCSRTQFPLMLGWAITIHKSQASGTDVLASLKTCFL